MARDVARKEIGGQMYNCTMMPATKANRTLISLTEIVGRPAVAMLSNAFVNDANIEISDLAGIGIATIFERFDEETGDRLIKNILDGVLCEGVGPVNDHFDEHFRGRILTLYQVFAWALEVNYKDFFDGARSSALMSKISTAVAKVQSRLTTIPTSSDSAQAVKG